MRILIAYAVIGILAAGLPTCRPCHKSAPKLKYDAHMASAQAYVDANDKAKAIDAYEKAILAAPDEDSRKEAQQKLKSIASWADSDWLSPAIKLLQAVWMFLVLLLVLLLVYVCRKLVQSCCDRIRKQNRVLIGPAGSKYAGYFHNLIRLTNHALEEQRRLALRLQGVNAGTVAASFRSNTLLAGMPPVFPAELAGKWWSVFVQWLMNAVDAMSYRYRVELGMMRSGSQCGVSVRLCCGETVLNHWHISCEDKELPKRSAELAYKVVVEIQGHIART